MIFYPGLTRTLSKFEEMRENIMRKIFVVLLYIVWAVLGLWSFLIELFYAYSLWGLMGIILGLTVFPILFTAMPFYILFAFGNFSPLILGVLSIIACIIAGAIND